MSDPFFAPYGDDFWRNNAQEEFNRQQTLIGVAIAKGLNHPRRIVDVGSGNGSILRGAAPDFESVHPGDVVAFESPEGVEAIKRLGVARVPTDWFQAVDLRAFIVSGDKYRFDLAICMEVAEHLPPECAELLVRNLCALSDTIAFSAAYPGQGGSGHINEQSWAYWQTLFNQRGYEMDMEATLPIVRAFMDQTPACWWYAKNLRIYRKVRDPSPRAKQRVLAPLEAAGVAKIWLAEASAGLAEGQVGLNLMCANRALPGWRNHDGQSLPGVTDSFWIDPWNPRLVGSNGVSASIQSAAEEYRASHPGEEVHVLHDQDARPGFPEDTFDYIYWNNGPEHVANIDAILQELWRISKDGAKWLLITPGYKDPASWGDPTHFSHWSWRLLDFYTEAGADGRHYPPALIEYEVVGDDDRGLDIYITVHKPGKGPDGRRQMDAKKVES